jgi:NAD/NADP transhydrogenase beta subunit
MTQAKKVIIVPGYGLAVANAQYAVADLVRCRRCRAPHGCLGPCQ